ncbi:MAG: DUF1036 domain-containing protein [Alphaproteobacteria bacterium]|nr:DUF1036 domain-containing protein [Alphaproteobacteria bacterium]
MLAIIAASVLTALSGQSSARPLPTVVELCNDTPARVTWSVTRPTGRSGRTQRGWFTVEPGQCREGGIGDGAGGTALVHARSGNLVWPAFGGEPMCVPAETHQRAARTPDACLPGDRAEAHERVAVDSDSRRHLIRHRVTCRQLGAQDGAICESGLRDSEGFLERVRTLEVCNHGGEPFDLAIAGESRDGRAWRVEGWREVPAQTCEDVWRGQAGSGLVHVRARDRDGKPVWDRDDARFCVAAEADFVRAAETSFETVCGSDGEAPAGFQSVRFEPGVSRFTLDFRGSNAD